MKTKLFSLCLCAALITLPLRSSATELPVIGDSASAIISLEEEYRIGRAWVRVLRGQAPLLNDPLVYSYVEDLVYRLSAHSALPDHRLTLVVLHNSSLNAFAVPGGIIGVHGGLFLYANTESEFASVLAHELAHLSQRHHAMTLEQRQKNMPWQLASTLATILLAAKSDGSHAAAAIVSSQAAMGQQNLAFSRNNEREADRIGMQVLADTGYEPRAMPKMFAHMQRAIAFMGQKAPEFLLTHPVTESRVADALNRSSQLSTDGLTDSLQYQLMQARVQVLLSRNTGGTFDRYRDAVQRVPNEVNHYGLALSAIRNNNSETAQQAIEWLLKKTPDSLTYRLALYEYLIATNQGKKAASEINELLQLYPNNHPLTMIYARILMQMEQQQKAVNLLLAHSRQYPENTQVWYELAEAQGLVNNILGVHQARAEYFLLVGNVSKAENHLKVALKLPNLTDHDKAVVNERIKEAKVIKEQLQF